MKETPTSRRRLRSPSTSSPGESAVIPMISFGKEASTVLLSMTMIDMSLFRWAIIGHANLFLLKKIEDDR